MSIFYSEIFDGIFFLEWGPQEVARILGYEENEKLPITIFAPTSDITQLKDKASFLKNSSKFSKCFVDNDNSLNEWMYGKRSPSKCAISIEDYEKWCHDQSSKWFLAIEKGLIKVKDWNDAKNGVDKIFPFERITRDSVEHLKNLPKELTTHINMILNLPSTATNERQNIRSEIINLAIGVKNNRDNLFLKKYSSLNLGVYVDIVQDQRANVLYFIDNISDNAQLRYLLFWWWNQLYMKAIAQKYHASYITFNSSLDNVLLFKNDNDSELFLSKEILLSLGLLPKNVSNMKLNLQKFSFFDKKEAIMINGSIIEDVMELTPSTFLQLKNNAKRIFLKDKHIKGGRIYDISLMISDVLDTSQTYRERFKSASIKLFVVGFASIFMILFDLEIIEKIGTFKNLWIVLILLLSIPWSEINDMLKLKKSKLSATITLYEE